MLQPSRAVRGFAAIANGPAEGPQKWSGGAARLWEALGGPARLGGCKDPELLMLSAFWLQRGTSDPPARGVPAKTLKFRVYTFTPPWEGLVRAPWWATLPGLHDVFCRS